MLNSLTMETESRLSTNSPGRMPVLLWQGFGTMQTFGRQLRRWAMLTAICLMTFVNSGCTLTSGFVSVLTEYVTFWEAPVPIPVSAYKSQQIEDELWEQERGRVAILDPIDGENAPMHCMDPPSDEAVMKALPDSPAGGFAFFKETHRNNVRIVKELIVDRLDDPRVYPLVGPARQKHCHYKCTVYYDKVIRSYWPIPFTSEDQSQEVVYIDKNYLIRVAGPQTY